MLRLMRKRSRWLPLVAILAVFPVDLGAGPSPTAQRLGRPGAILREAERNRADYERAARRRYHNDMEKMSELIEELLALRSPFDEEALDMVRGNTDELEKRIEKVIDYLGLGEETEGVRLRRHPFEVSEDTIRELARLTRRAQAQVRILTSNPEILDLDLLSDSVADMKAAVRYSRLLREAVPGR